MTQSRGGMREIYPEAGEVYRYRIEDRENQFTFNLEGDVAADLKPPITLGIESPGGPGKGYAALRRAVSTPSAGPGSARSCTCGWKAICSCSSGRTL